MSLHAARYEVRRQPRPGVFRLAGHDGIAVLQGLVLTVGGMDPAQDDRHAALAELGRELVRPRSVTGHDRDAYQIRRILEIARPDRLVLAPEVPILRRGTSAGRTTQ